MEILLSFLLFASAASLTPGPSNIMVMSLGMNCGIKKTLPSVWGITSGFAAMIITVGFGLSFIFVRYSYMNKLVKIVGAAYLLYFAWMIFRATPDTNNNKNNSCNPLTFFQAFLFSWINPKAWVMATSAIATYVSVTSDSAYLQILTTVVVFFLMSAISGMLWMFFGTWISKVLKSKLHYRMFNVIMASLLIISVIPTLHETICLFLLKS